MGETRTSNRGRVGQPVLTGIQLAMNAMDNVQANAPEAVWALVGIAGAGQSTRKVVIGGLQVLVGRLDDNDLRLDSRGVSKQHAHLKIKDGKLWVRDLASTNGTFVNGRRISDETLLNHGDVVQFGNVPFQVTCSNSIIPEQTQAELVVDRAMALLQFDRLMSQRAVTPHFQPIVTFDKQNIIAFEVLARSRIVGLETAKDMFDAASYVQQEVELSRMLRDEGLRLATSIDKVPTIFLNTHPAELADDGLIPSIQKLRTTYPDLKLALEIHEAGVTDPGQMSKLQAQLRDMDVAVAYDDFGAGQARLLELVEVPPKYLKFDGRLIQSIHSAPQQRQRMLAALVQMVTELGIVALAEGIECAEDGATCQQLGFQLAQGYFYGRPADASKWRRRS